MKISVIIPNYNEEKTIKEIIERVKKLRINKEIIVVDDGSTDKSLKIIKEINGIKFYHHKKNMGKGAAIRTGIKNATGEIIIMQDADLELYPEQIPDIVEPILSNKAEAVYGSRNGNGREGRMILFYLGGHLVTFTTNLLYGTKLTDAPCGYKAFKTDLIKSIEIKSDGFEFEPEITAKLSKKGVKIYEIPVRSTTRKNDGKKLTKFDGIKALWTLIKYRFKS